MAVRNRTAGNEMKSHMRSLGISRDISEMCLNHKLQGVEGIYDQYSYYEERRVALQTWADFLEKCRCSFDAPEVLMPIEN
jgi:hypothetical protein